MQDDLVGLSGVGERTAELFAQVGVRTVYDLLHYFPRTYSDFSNLTPIAQLKPDVPMSVQARITQVSGRYVRRGMHITEAIAHDDTGPLRLIWFNQPYRQNAIKKDVDYFISGTLELKRQRFAMTSPSIELASDFPVNTARVVPVYRQTKGLKSTAIRRALRSAFEKVQINEHLPQAVIKKHQLVERAVALKTMHFPESMDAVAAAKRRLGFEEVFEFAAASQLNELELAREHALKISFNEDLAKQFVASLPFDLTDHQRAAAWQICKDMQSDTPMNRLLEGDVGAGKTAVAALSALSAIDAGYQVAIMAPTEILARQHADGLKKLLKPIGLDGEVQLLIGGMSSKQKADAQAAITAGERKLIVGTHALIQDKVAMDNLAYVVVDEQHRFGVGQRKALQAKANGRMPHVLHMTATPIPRSLALTVYGELDISVIASRPGGRKPIKTQIVSPNSRKPMYDAVRAELDTGRQAFVVTPLIQEGTTQKTNATAMHEKLSRTEFKNYRVGLLHGKMKPAEKAAVMNDFVAHKTDVLVSTTVIEVGVDVPNASVMILENADTFGLAQAHQLRGRVGRGTHQGHCYLVMSDSSAPTPRMKALERTNDGFALAELDLEIRGPGAIYGRMQHGALDLRVADLTDTQLIAAARQAAVDLIASDPAMKSSPELAQKVTTLRTITNLN